MTDKLEAWWRPTTPEEAADLEQQQADFKAQFGDFNAVAADGFWLGCSPDGQRLAFQFKGLDGSIHRHTLPWHIVDVFFTQFSVAVDEMGQRQFALKQPAGAA
ncbi:hypothetical protein X735_09870 [Mesorhizobium sp. L2C085B000]|uniref:hypothetical protein n=1 Tax=Mesorhizobium sp. L2C085B000 TaxID=1287117 RepID=UPI0003CFCED2|nr:MULTISPECIES: hypothetical protein [unclassified Mesorhizobium]ESZ17695.1 hypothetical protein X735_09870 [Mesorhizobium sp. L2C085B000]ESZ46252.1 hypothetical protein X731_16335 [Mesorhizobium sp. L2C054A000]